MSRVVAVVALVAACSSSAPSTSPASDARLAPTAVCPGTSSPHLVYNAWWNIFDRYYAVFGERLPADNWADLGVDGCGAIDGSMSDDDLFGALLDLVQNLDDTHVTLESRNPRRWGDAWVSVYPDYDALYALEFEIEEHYLDAPLEWGAQRWFSWGSVGDIGYISLTSFDELSSAGDSEFADRATANRVMSEIMVDLAGKTGIVVDVRANEGGWDTVGLEVARWFEGPRALAWSKQVRNGPAHDDLGRFRDTYVGNAYANAFDGPVVLLTSGGTVSAAETFTLAMRARDNVTLVGEPGSGHFSDMNWGRLPNGWEFSLSGERYQADDGEVYEARGVPVDIGVDLDVPALYAGTDVMFEAALVQLGATP